MLVEHIDDLNDSRLDEFRDLKRSNVTRSERFFIAEGRWVVERLLASRISIRSILLSEKRLKSFGPKIPNDVPVKLVSHELCSQLVGFDFHAGVMASANRPTCRQVESSHWTSNRDLMVCCPATFLPDNLGSLIRLAAAFEAAGMIVGPTCADPFSRRAVRVSMGNILQLPIIEPTDLWTELLRLRNEQRVQIIATGRRNDSIPLRDFARRPRVRRVVMFGNEAHGLSKEWLDLADAVLEIEMSPHVDSLNVATAAAICLYELSR
ncbi:MAG TPA: RNA methyltransferase [Pirellulaceae bacterium]|nr:RNA methyltransferase [Pirellulaceae bacterium]